MGSSMPSIQAPTPFTGTYSGMNPYDASYFQQVQQNYNRLFPTTPANVAGPLESWYQTKYVPDTTISNKLFGV
jgi:TorA maturation chaperone TorD